MSNKGIVAWVCRHFHLGDLRLDRCLGELVASCAQATRLSFAELGRGLAGAAQEASKIRRAFEFAHNERVREEVVQETLISLLTRRVPTTWKSGVRQIVVAIDWHVYDAGSVSGLRISLMTGTRALPLVWFEVPTKELKGQRTNIELRALQRLIQWRPEGIQWLLLGDAGFRSPATLNLLEEIGYYIVRSASHMMVSSMRRPESWKRIGNLPIKAGQIVEYRWLNWNRHNPRALRLVCARIYDAKPPCPSRRKSAKRGRYKYSKPGLCAIITNLPDDQFSKRDIVRLYGRRFEIEHSFRDIRNASFGLDMEHSHFQEISTYSRLMIIVAINEAMLWLVGSEAEKRGFHRRMTPSRPKNGRRVLSLRTLGRLALKKIRIDLDELISRHLFPALEHVLWATGSSWEELTEGLVAIPVRAALSRARCTPEEQPSWKLLIPQTKSGRTVGLRCINA